MDQDLTFLQSEGNNYYRRNVHNFSPEFDIPLQMIPGRPRNVLEIGCAQGSRLEEIRLRFHHLVRAVGPEESRPKAMVERGPKIFQALSARGWSIPALNPRAHALLVKRAIFMS